jgi:hypothetical protein
MLNLLYTNKKFRRGKRKKMTSKKTKAISKMIFVVAIMLTSVFVMLTAIALPATAAGKGTVVNDDITEDTRWTLAGSPYILDGRAITAAYHPQRYAGRSRYPG